MVGTQTDKSDTQDVKDEDEVDEEPLKKMPCLSPPGRVSEAEVQARLDKASADLTQQLKKQHEDDKAKALKDLTDRVSSAFSL